MATQSEITLLQDQIAALRARLAEQTDSDLVTNPALADALRAQVDQLLRILTEAEATADRPPDGGLAQLAGVGDETARRLGETRLPVGVTGYDENVASERLLALADLYYIYQ